MTPAAALARARADSSTSLAGLGLPLLLAVAATLSLVTWDWIPGASLLVLAFAWRWLRADVGPPVLALAMTLQWAQVVVGVLYNHLTGRPLPELTRCNYERMVLLGLGCVASLSLGLGAGMRLHRPAPKSTRAAAPATVRETPGFPLRTLASGYVIATLLTGSIQAIAWQFSSVTQAILALSLLRYAILFLLLRRLIQPTIRWGPVVALLTFEVVIGFTGFFAGFREGLMIATLAVLEAFQRRRASHWALLGLLAAILLGTGTLWTGIKHDYRRQFRDESFAASTSTRLESVESLSLDWLDRDGDRKLSDVDRMVSRVWAVYYPALAIARVPSVLPYEHGAILLRAVQHILMPRLFFPNKKSLDSDSEMVRKYSGLWVASTKQGTSIAFGYAAESYIDFGAPGMFFPIALFGLIMGWIYRKLLRTIHNREIALACISTVFWVPLALFERSWMKILGVSGTLIIVLGGGAILLDRLLARRNQRAPAPTVRPPVAPRYLAERK